MDMEIVKGILRKIQYGLYILTAQNGEEIAAGTIIWLSQCSFKPPLVMTGVRMDSNVFRVLKSSGKFAVNMVGASQQDVAASFFRPSQIDAGAINGIPYHHGVTNTPILEGLPGFFECEIRDILERGDHVVVVGEIVEAGINNDEATLLLSDTEWRYDE